MMDLGFWVYIAGIVVIAILIGLPLVKLQTHMELEEQHVKQVKKRIR